MPIRTKEDEAEWRAWRRESILTAQRDRRAGMRRIDYYASPEADAIIDRLRRNRAGGDVVHPRSETTKIGDSFSRRGTDDEAPGISDGAEAGGGSAPGGGGERRAPIHGICR